MEKVFLKNYSLVRLHVDRFESDQVVVSRLDPEVLQSGQRVGVAVGHDGHEALNGGKIKFRAGKVKKNLDKSPKRLLKISGKWIGRRGFF